MSQETPIFYIDILHYIFYNNLLFIGKFTDIKKYPISGVLREGECISL